MEKLEENEKNGFIKKIFHKKLSYLNSELTNRKNEKNINFTNLNTKKPYITIIKKNKIEENSKNNSAEYVKIQNANEIWHLLNGKEHGTKSEVNWSINLRDYEINKKKITFQKINPPSFYEIDEKKYKKKNLTKSNSAKEVFVFNKFKHLLSTSTSGETLDNNTFIFQRTLRKFKLKKEHIFNHKNKWNNITSNSFLNSSNYLPVNDKLNEKYILRPYKIIRKNTSFGDLEIKQRKYVKDDKFALNWFGEHLSKLPYKDIYKCKNFYEFENILTGKNQSRIQLFFELGLRNQFEKKNKKNVIKN